MCPRMQVGRPLATVEESTVDKRPTSLLRVRNYAPTRLSGVQDRLELLASVYEAKRVQFVMKFATNMGRHADLL